MMPSIFSKRPHSSMVPRKQKGAVAVITAFALVSLIGVGAFAIDFAHAYVVRNELQNNADASALAGASCLFPNEDCKSAGLSGLTWEIAKTKATDYLQHNKAESRTVSSADIAAGYWNMNSSTFTNGPLPVGSTPSSADVPAVRVAISLDADSNGGGATTFLSRIFGIRDMPLNAQAVAITSSPHGVASGQLMPFVVSECLLRDYWDSTANKPKSTGSAPKPIEILDEKGRIVDTIPQEPNKAYVFPGVSVYSFQGVSCNAGQWTSLGADTSSASKIRELITEGNPDPMAIGGPIDVATGKMDNLYSAVGACAAEGTRSCEYGIVPVIKDLTKDSSKTPMPQTITAFACVRIITDGKKNDTRYLKMQFVENNDNCNTSGVPGGPNFGAFVPPRLAL